MNIFEIQRSKEDKDFVLKNGTLEFEVFADILKTAGDSDSTTSGSKFQVSGLGSPDGSIFEKNPIENLPKDWEKWSDQELAVWYNDNVIYPDKVRLNCYYYRNYSFVKDIQMILCTVLGRNMKYAGEII